MPTYDRRFLFGSLTTAAPPALLLCVLLWRPNLLEDGSTSWLKPMFQPEQYRAEKLDRAQACAVLRMEARRAIVWDLAVGRLALLEAAARMRGLDRRNADFPWEIFRPNHPAASDDERHCLEVIEQLRAHAPLGGSPTEELALRLEEELREHLARGTLRLPDTEAVAEAL
jgi:hypothetical protein